ncbi:alpha/beta hydrolase family protein [Caulobacter soli]|uniref:alpha/beta hydrolase family protein n=1 Tax=Caulobacter soli TaxID=2708539 RepID=UPI0013EAA9C0|nr:alpha/beta fold hydrolase [Caulobacter soli]
MKPFLVPMLVASLAAATPVFAQDLTPVLGDWYGTLNVGVKIPLVLHIKGDGSATLDSPAQGASGLPANASLDGSAVTVVLTTPAARFEGQVAADGASLVGEWRGRATAPLTFTRTAPVVAVRPQTPKPPFPYHAEDVTYVNPASGLKLAGTLTLPQGPGPFPVALMITGSGTQDRDETIEGHKPFLLIADALTRKGVAVLRVDDRGAGGSEAGKTIMGVTSADFATDVDAGVAFLRARKDIDPDRIGLIGHSEGGLIAPMVAAKDPRIAFVAMIGGPGVNGERVLLSQTRALMLAHGAPLAKVDAASTENRAAYEIVKAEPDPAAAAAKLKALFVADGAPEATAERKAAILSLPWMRYFLTADPVPNLKALKCPVLDVNGSQDLEVAPAINLPPIRAALAQNPDAAVKELPGLNHLLQTVPPGQAPGYGAIDETMAPAALALIVDWVAAHAKPG